MEQRVNTLAEKMAAVEVQLKNQADALEKAGDERAALNEELKETNERLQQLLTKVARWEGKFGGVLFIVGCLWAFFSGFGKAVVAWAQAFGGFGK